MTSYTSIYSKCILMCFHFFIISSLSQSHGTLLDRKVLNVGKELWEETLPLQMGSRLYELHGLKSSTWYEVKISYPASIPSSFSLQLKRGKTDIGHNWKRKLLNTEKLIFKADGDYLHGMHILVTVEPAGVVAIPNAPERKFVIFNIVCDELLFGIPHKAYWVAGLVILCLVLAFIAPNFLRRAKTLCSEQPISKDS